jgi:phage virion morphogenesis protein
MSDLAQLGEMAGALLRSVSPAERRKLLRTMARDLQASQRARIGQQQAPDGSAYPARRIKPVPSEQSRLRRRGAIRRTAMFKKLRLARNLKAGASDAEAWVGFVGRAGRIARVHQEGGVDRPSSGQKPVRYAKRVLIGPTPAEEVRLLDMLLAQVNVR